MGAIDDLRKLEKLESEYACQHVDVRLIVRAILELAELLEVHGQSIEAIAEAEQEKRIDAAKPAVTEGRQCNDAIRR